MNFFKSLLASILGCFIVIGIFILISVIAVMAMTLGSDEKYNLKDNTVLTL
jgi:protease-4